MVIPEPTVIPLPFWSIILRFRDVNSPFLSFLYRGVTGSKLVNYSELVMQCLSRTLLRFPSSRLSELLSSFKLITISITPANLLILMTFTSASSAIITFLLMNKFISLSINVPSSTIFSSFVISSTFKGFLI